MSDTQVGGNGSVHWITQADEVTSDVLGNPRQFGHHPQLAKGAPRRVVQFGVDASGRPEDRGERLVVRVKLPQGQTGEQWVKQVTFEKTAAGETLAVFAVPLENDARVPHTQVQITWGREEPWNDRLADRAMLAGEPADAASA